MVISFWRLPDKVAKNHCICKTRIRGFFAALRMTGSKRLLKKTRSYDLAMQKAGFAGRNRLFRDPSYLYRERLRWDINRLAQPCQEEKWPEPGAGRISQQDVTGLQISVAAIRPWISLRL